MAPKVKKLSPVADHPINGRAHWAANLRQDEAIPVQPLGVLGVELHELVEKDVGDGSHAPVTAVSGCFGVARRGEEQENSHGGTGVTGVGMEGRISL